MREKLKPKKLTTKIDKLSLPKLIADS